MTARPIPRTHRDGYRRPGMDRPFWLVQCDDCHVVCNSGHHYEDPTFAQAEADRHNATNHPTEAHS